MTLAWDSETFLIRADCQAPPLVCISWAMPSAHLLGGGPTAGLFKHDGDGLGGDPRDALRTWHENYHTVGHNLAYDLAVIAAQYPELIPTIFEALAAGRCHDTMLREKLRDIAIGGFRWRALADGTHEKINYHLADLAARRLGLMLSKGEDTWRLRYGELHGAPLAQWPAEARDYSVSDATTTLAVYEHQEREREGIRKTFGVDIYADEAAQVRAAFWMQLMSAWGMPLDSGRVGALEEAITRERAELEEDLIDEGLVRIEYHSIRARNPEVRGKEKKRTRDAKAAQAYMLGLCIEAGTPPKVTAKGGICVDAEACEDTGDPLMMAYAQYSALGNVLGKDVKAMRGMSRIHGRFDSLIASGRTASRSQMVDMPDGSKIRIGLNLQNLRVEGTTRECFVPPPGWVFCLIDLTAAELYAVAQLCINMFGFSKLAEVLNANPPIDPHVYLASNVARRPYDELLAAVKSGEKDAKTQRQTCKNANYGLWGGMRAKRFAALVKRGSHGKILLSETDANILRDTFLQTWSEAPLYLGHFEAMCRNGKRATVVQYKSNRIRGGLRYSESANTGFQGLIADLMKDAGFRVSREMYDHTRNSVLYGSRIGTFPHDELVCIVPEDRAHECAMRIQEIVLSTGREWIPDVPPAGEVYLSAYWSKKAKPVHDAAGRLIPWGQDG